MLKISPMKGVKRFIRKEKLVPRYIRLFRIVGKVGVVSYRLELPDACTDVMTSSMY